jgi:hypothetical protein
MKHFCLSGLVLILILIPLRSFSQSTTIYYTYDNAGNLIEKVIHLNSGLKSAKINNNTKNPVSPVDSSLIKDNSFKSGEVKIYPNPTRGIVEIELPSDSGVDSEFQFIVLDVNGRVIIDKRKEPFRTSLDLSNQPNGIYFLHIRSGSLVSKWKIIKQ